MAACTSCSFSLRAAPRPSSAIKSRAAAQRPRAGLRSPALVCAAAVQVTLIPSASEADIEKMGCRSWSTWGCGVSKFPWSYGETEVSLLIEGEVVVTPDGGEPVTIKAGDIATFPSGMSCTWDVKKPIRKHYTFK